jgi:hypothetical protein
MTLLVMMLPAKLFAQNEATQGKWDRLYYDVPNRGWQVVRWRKLLNRFPDATYRSQVDQQVGAYAPADAWEAIHGIHAALVPVVGDTDFPRGWVLLWGYGRERGYLRDRSNQIPRLPSGNVDPYYPSGYWVGRVALTPVLLWHPEAESLYGYTRYLFDSKPDRTSYEEWDPSSEAEIGSWPIFNLFCSAHAFLPDGRLLAVGGHGGLWANEVPVSGEDTIGYVGLRLVAKFNGLSFRRTRLEVDQPLWSWGYWPNQGLHEPRWYPSVVALPDGKVLIVGGTHYGFWNVEGMQTERHELYDPCTDRVEPSRDPVPSDSDLSRNYPRVLLVSYWTGSQVDGAVVSVGPSNRVYRLSNPSDPSSYFRDRSPNLSVSRGAGTAVLLPNPVLNPRNASQQVLNQVLLCGGDSDPNRDHTYDARNSTEIVTFTATGHTVLAGAPMHRGRADFSAVLLPNGQIVVIGGRAHRGLWNHLNRNDTVYVAELYTPHINGGAGSWQLAAEAFATDADGDNLVDLQCDDIFTCNDADGDGLSDGIRVYHSTALLLPDGRVLAAGSATADSNRAPVNNYVPTIYSPPYLFKSDGAPRTDADRPQIRSLSHTELNYGEQFTVEYQLARDGAGIQSIVLVRPGSVTHSVNFEQRLVRLHYLLTNPDQGLAVVVAPWHPAIAPPGWYMLFLVDANGVPSKAAWVRLKHTCPPLLSSFVALQLEGVDQISPEQAEAIANEPITLEFRNATTRTTIATYTLPMARPDTQGQVRLEVWSDLPAGVYEVYVHPYRSWLGQRVLVNWQPGGRLVVPLRNGDVVKDNQVDYADLVLVLAMQGATGLSVADVNGDGVVNEEDAVIVAQNVGQQGDE